MSFLAVSGLLGRLAGGAGGAGGTGAGASSGAGAGSGLVGEVGGTVFMALPAVPAGQPADTREPGGHEPASRDRDEVATLRRELGEAEARAAKAEARAAAAEANLRQSEARAERLGLEVRDQLARFTYFFAHLPVGMLFTTLDGKVVFANDEYLRIVGRTRQELEEGRIWWSELTPPEWLAVDRRHIGYAMERGWSDMYEKEYVRGDGSRISVLVGFTVHGVERMHATALVIDLTENKRLLRESQMAVARFEEASRQAEAARKSAEEANAAKDRFFAVLSHELRTPLTPVSLIVAALAEDERLPADVREQLAIVRNNVGLEVRLIDDMLDLSRVMSGKLRIDRRPMKLRPAVDDAVRIHAGFARDRGVRVGVVHDPGDDTVLGDEARMRQVVWNLVGNAVKFTPPGGSVGVRTVRVSEGGGEWMQLSVTDSGVGMDEATLGRIFLPFSQGAAAERLRTGGLGLGLAVSQALVEAHGGTIRAWSAGPGRGSTFRVRVAAHAAAEPPQSAAQPSQSAAVAPLARPERVPTAPSAASSGSLSGSLSVSLPTESSGGLHRQVPANPAGSKPSPPEGSGFSVLLVEDHPDTARFLARLLNRRGHSVVIAGSVAEAISASAASRFDVIISDLGLPDGSGVDLIREVRKSLDTPAVAISGYGTEQDVAMSLSAGFNEHLVKPATVDAIEAAMRRIAGRNTADARSRPSAGPAR